MSVFESGHPVLAVLNIHSGWNDGSACQKLLEGTMRDAGVPLQVIKVRRGTDVPAVVRDACAKGVTAVIAGGGDGTLNAVARGLQGSNVPMAIVPIGTLNHLARDLSVPIDATKAIRALPGGHEISMDLGEVNGRVFLNNSILGLYPAYSFARERREKIGLSKMRAILSAILTIFRRNPVLTLWLTVDGREMKRRTPYILIANNEHKMEGYQLGHREQLDAGVLWVYVMKPRSRWGLVKLLASLLFGRFRRHEEFEVFPAASMRVESKRTTMGVALDGDVTRMRTPLEYRSLSKALRVIAPAQTA